MSKCSIVVPTCDTKVQAKLLSLCAWLSWCIALVKDYILQPQSCYWIKDINERNGCSMGNSSMWLLRAGLYGQSVTEPTTGGSSHVTRLVILLLKSDTRVLGELPCAQIAGTCQGWQKWHKWPVVAANFGRHAQFGDTAESRSWSSNLHGDHKWYSQLLNSTRCHDYESTLAGA